jgi:hypothetical protein
MRIIIEPGRSNNLIATIAIGEAHYKIWEQKALPQWIIYCKRYDIGLVAFDEDLIPQTDAHWKKATWQKLLIGNALKTALPSVNNVCFLDTDILINPFAPNVFNSYDPETVGLVSLRKNLPYPYNDVLRRVAFLRNRYYDNKYPLDSALFISVEELYKYHGVTVQEDEACAGFFVFNIANHSEMMASRFAKYDRHVESITGGGDQTHFNFEIQAHARISWLDYRFQAIWLFEMAWKYPFLYDYGKNNNELIKECIESSLFTNYFLHFAGSWHESDMWKIDGILQEPDTQQRFNAFNEYVKLPVTGKPVGQVKPHKS